MESFIQNSGSEEEGEYCQTFAAAEARGKVPEGLDLHVWQLLTRTALAHPQREAIVSSWQPQQLAENSQPSCTHKGSCLRWTYQDIYEKSDLVASALWKVGCQPGMRLGALLWNSAEWALLFWATARMGVTFVPIDPRDLVDARRMLGVVRVDIVVAQDNHLVGIIDDEMMAGWPGLIRVQCSGTPTEGWLSFHRLLAYDTAKLCHDGISDDQKLDLDSVVLIVFTSGTSGRSKGCVHKSRNLISQTNNYDPNEDESVVDRWLVHTPVSHIFAINNMLRAWRLGHAVVFPSKAFDVDLTIRALIGERCTIMSATPTLVKAMISHPSFPGAGAVMLNLVTIAATVVRIDDIRICQERLGTKNSIQAYGMSEGAPLISWARTDEKIKAGSHHGVGRVLPGAAIRVCHPDTRKVLARNEVGELHVGGPSVIDRYLDDADADSFYDETSARWLMTGDQGMMDSEGVVHIFGRYKDIIIRGGENINPVVIEEVLSDLPGVEEAHIVGVPDTMAGELPVAVVKLDPTASKMQVRRRVFNLGSRFALDEVYTFAELSIKNVPTTSLNKVKKQELRRIVLNYRQNRDDSRLVSSFATSNDMLTQALVTVWEDLTGYRPTVTEIITHTADSILLLRYCDAVFRSCGQRMYLQDVVKHDTIGRQVAVLRDRMSHQSLQGADPCVSNYEVAGSLSGIALQKDRVIWRSTLKPGIISNTGVKGHHSSVLERGIPEFSFEKELKVLELGRSVVEDIIPIRNSLHRTACGQRPQSYRVRMVFRAHHTSIQQIIRGTEKALASHAMLRAILLRKSGGILEHLIIKTDHQLLETLISTRHVKSEIQAQEHWENDSVEKHSPSFMFHCEIINVQDTGNNYLSLQYSHSVVDALSLWPWHRDLDRLINDISAEITVQTPYTRFSELFSLYEDSPLAKRAALFHVKRLRGISRLTQALWPVQRAPGWMISNDEGSCFAAERHRVRDQVWDGEWEEKAALFRYPRIGRVVHVPQVQRLKYHGVEASLFAKCAIFLFNILQTGSSHAILNTWEGGRSWPFVPLWIESTLPSAMSVGGPTAQWILNLVEVYVHESLMDYFRRIVSDFRELEQHQHAPWQKIVEELRDEGALAEDASFRQGFVWDVSLGLPSSSGFRNDMKTLEPVARMDWADCGLFWNAFMIDAENLYFIASWDTAQMNDLEVGKYCDLLADVMRKLANEENWHRTIASVFKLE